MATYSFRFGFVGFAQDPSTWYNQTAGAVATQAPGIGDTIKLITPNGDLHGDATVDQVFIAAPTGATPFTISGSVTAKQFTQSSALALASGAILTLLGRDTNSSPTTITAATTLTNATLAVTGTLAVQTGSLSAVQSSTVTANSLTVGTATLNLPNSALAIHGTVVAATLNTATPSTGIAHITLSNNAGLTTDGAINLGATGAADLTATTGTTIAANALTLGAAGTGTASLTNSTLTVAQRITIADSGTGSLSLNATTASAQDLAIALASTARGTLSLAAGANLQLQSPLYLAPAGTALIQLTGAGTLLASLSPATFAGTGNTTLALTAGAQAQFTGLAAAATQGGTTTISLDGTNTRLTLAGPAFLGPTDLGQPGTATLALTNGASLTAQDLTLGNARLTDSAATITAARVTGDARSSLTLSTGGTLAAITLSLAGPLALAANSSVTAVAATLAATTLTTGSTVSVTTLTLTGALTISAGATLSATTLSGTAPILITGPGSRLTLANQTTAPITLAQGATLALPNMTFGATTPTIDASSLITIGATPPQTATGFAVGAAATLTLSGTTIAAPITNAGIISATNSTLAVGTGTGTYQIAGGTLDIASFAGTATFTNQFAALRLRALSGPATITNIRPGDIIDLPGQTGTLVGNTLTIGKYALTLTAVVGTSLHLDALPTGTRLTVIDPLFDPAYYLAHNPDVAAAGFDPYQHFATFGWAEGRDPSALFSTAYYRATYPDLAGQNPLTQFEQSGWQSGRNPNPYFNTTAYLAQNRDVATAGVNPLLHYQTYGWREGRNPSPSFSLTEYRAAYGPTTTDPLTKFLTTGMAAGQHAIGTGPSPEPGFDPAYYYAHNPDVLAAGSNAMQHWLSNGAHEGRAPDPLFDPSYYSAQYADAGPDPLAQYMAAGAAQGRDPSLLFSTTKYLLQNPDVTAARLNPLLHYLNNGQYEGRAAFLSGPTAAADPLVQTAFYDRQLGASLIPAGIAANQQAAASYNATGWQRGLNPDALFDTNYYLAHNTDVAAAHINPLLHYESYGWHEGRNPSASFDTRAYLSANPDVSNAGVNPLAHYLQFGQNEGRQAIPVRT